MAGEGKQLKSLRNEKGAGQANCVISVALLARQYSSVCSLVAAITQSWSRNVVL